MFALCVESLPSSKPPRGRERCLPSRGSPSPPRGYDVNIAACALRVGFGRFEVVEGIPGYQGESGVEDVAGVAIVAPQNCRAPNNGHAGLEEGEAAWIHGLLTIADKQQPIGRITDERVQQLDPHAGQVRLDLINNHGVVLRSDGTVADASEGQGKNVRPSPRRRVLGATSRTPRTVQTIYSVPQLQGSSASDAVE